MRAVLLIIVCALGLTAGNQEVLERALDLAAHGKQAEAVLLLEPFVKANPANADARLLLGSLLMETNQKDASLENLRAAVRLRPHSHEAENALGEALNKFGNTREAKEAFGKSVALKPDYGIAQLNLGQALLTLGDRPAATEHLRRAVALLRQTDDAADAHYLLAKVFSEQGEPKQSAVELEAAVRIRPGFAQAWSDLGEARKLLLDDSAALAAFQKAVEADPRDKVAQYRLGNEYLRQGDPHAAAACFRKAYELDPTDQSTLNGLQRALRQEGDSEGANRVKEQLADLLRGRDRNNENKLAAVRINNEGAALEKAGDVRSAIEKYRQASSLDPDHAGIRMNYGVALLRVGDWREGLEELHQAYLRDPANAQLRAVLQDALSQAPGSAQPAWKADIH